MRKENITIVFNVPTRNLSVDLEIPLYISANELVTALNFAYKLNIDISDVKNCYLKSEYPIALLKGNKTLNGFGIRNGSIISFTDEG